MDDDLAELDGDEFGWNADEDIDLDLDLGLDAMVIDTPLAKKIPSS